MKHKFGLFAAALFFLLMGGLVDTRSALSFHFGGVGSCDSCHSMHDARDTDAEDDNKSKSLLLASDPSSVCLNCHTGPGGLDRASVFSMDGSAMTPGGDFYWLTKTFTWAGGASAGENHGHNVIARDFNLGQDLRLTQGPGGNYQSADLGCTSCHDPHGQTGGGTKEGVPPVSVSGSYGEQPASSTTRGNYRLLGDASYDGGRAAEGYRFTYNAPVARQNLNSRFGESDGSHVDYGSGMSEWCGNCHEGVLRNDHSGAGSFNHPSGSSRTLTGEMITMYNTYINTGDLLAVGTGTGTGNSATAYLQFVPFERGISDQQQLDPTNRKGPNSNSRIMCLTCHRVHASAFQSIGRWDFDAVLLAESHPGPGDGGLSGNDVYHSYYGRNLASEFGSDQGPFCEKCHGSDQEPLFEPFGDSLFDPGQQPLPPGDPLLQDPFLP